MNSIIECILVNKLLQIPLNLCNYELTFSCEFFIFYSTYYVCIYIFYSNCISLSDTLNTLYYKFLMLFSIYSLNILLLIYSYYYFIYYYYSYLFYSILYCTLFNLLSMYSLIYYYNLTIHYYYLSYIYVYLYSISSTPYYLNTFLFIIFILS